MQYGTPDELYNYPNSIFVGGFIGSLSMNFIKTSVVEHGAGIGGKLTVNGEEHIIPFPDFLKKYQGKTIILGLRPENINNLEHHEIKNHYTIKINIDLTEPTGPDTLVFFDINGGTVSARCIPNPSLKIDTETSLNIDCDCLRFFDPESGKAITG